MKEEDLLKELELIQVINDGAIKALEVGYIGFNHPDNWKKVSYDRHIIMGRLRRIHEKIEVLKGRVEWE